MRSSSGSNSVVSEGVEASFIYVRFEAAADEVTVLFAFTMKYYVTIILKQAVSFPYKEQSGVTTKV